MKNKRNIIIAVIVIVIIIGVIIYMNSSTPNPTPYIGVNNYDLSKLSQQDFDAYNSLPNDAAKLDFLRILESQGKVTKIVPPAQPGTNVPDNNTTTSSQPGTTQNESGTSTKKQNVFTRFEHWLGNLFHKKTTNVSGYTQVLPIDENGCDANGYNAIGVKCL